MARISAIRPGIPRGFAPREKNVGRFRTQRTGQMYVEPGAGCEALVWRIGGKFIVVGCPIGNVMNEVESTDRECGDKPRLEHKQRKPAMQTTA